MEVPTLEEMIRIKAWLYLTRKSTRDLLDVVALLEKAGPQRVKSAFASFDEIYGRGPGAGPPLLELTDCLSEARPEDGDRVELSSYKGAVPPWSDRVYLVQTARGWAAWLARLLLQP